jgi:hypothetical protein
VRHDPDVAHVVERDLPSGDGGSSLGHGYHL